MTMLGQVLALDDVGIIREGRVDRHGQQFLVAAGFVLEEQDGDRPGPDHRARDEGRAGDHQCVERIAVGRQRMRDEAVIGRIAHRRVEDAVDEQGARFLVELILDRLAADRDLDDHVEAVGRIVAGRDEVDVHGRQAPPGSGKMASPGPNSPLGASVGAFKATRPRKRPRSRPVDRSICHARTVGGRNPASAADFMRRTS